MTQRATEWNYDEDRTYHGVQRDDDAENDRIEIELAEYGCRFSKCPA